MQNRQVSRARTPSFPNNCLCSMHYLCETAFPNTSSEACSFGEDLLSIKQLWLRPLPLAQSELAANLFPLPLVLASRYLHLQANKLHIHLCEQSSGLSAAQTGLWFKTNSNREPRVRDRRLFSCSCRWCCFDLDSQF